MDAHCHVTTVVGPKDMWYDTVSAGTARCVMTCNYKDWKVAKDRFKGPIGFGIHPWYAHLFSIGNETDKELHYRQVLESKDCDELTELIKSLPAPRNVEDHIRDAIEDNWERVRCIGEVGLDKVFWLRAEDMKWQGHIRVRIDHQVAVFRRMCQLAAFHGLPVSIHVVKAQALVYRVCCEELLSHGTKICLHSYTGNPQFVKQFWLRTFTSHRMFFSISEAINLKNVKATQAMIFVIPPHCILSESDLFINVTDPETIEAKLKAVQGIIQEAYALQSTQEVKHLLYSNFCSLFSI